ncbi:MAG: hypothetical protein ACTIJQ_11230 [Alcaligenes sp.]
MNSQGNRMSSQSRLRTAKGKGLLGPGADEAFALLVAPEIRQRVLLAHWVARSRDTTQQYLGFPLGRLMLRRWMRSKAGSRRIEAFGLPRHIVLETLGEQALTLHVNPRALIRMAIQAPRNVEKRPSSLAFIWEGSWDRRREDLRVGTRYSLISDLDENRHQLEQTARFKKLMARIEQGNPWESYQQGVFLDTPEKIIEYLRIYLGFLDEMAQDGFDLRRGKDALGVVISREGRILKINRGLHRLAMAQRLGLPSVPVQVRHVHRLWWDRVTAGATGELALHRMQQALHRCVPETKPGPLDKDPDTGLKDDFWPAPRAGSSV